MSEEKSRHRGSSRLATDARRDSIGRNSIDTALENWPVRERSRLAWDEAAERTLARAMSTDPKAAGDSISDSELLRPPLPMTMRERYGANFRIGGWLWVGGVAAAAAMAGGLFVLGERHRNEAAAAGTRGSPALTLPGAPAPKARPSGVAVVSTLDERGVDPADLPRARADLRGAGPPAGVSSRTSAGAPMRPSGADPTSPAASEALAPDLTGAPDGVNEGLQPAAAVAAGSSLAGAAGSVPLRPSMGAVQGAIGAALPGARACLAPGDAPARATVTFTSGGTVGDVLMSSGRGGPAERCIRSVLSKAQVPPFAEPSFVYTVTVRPN
jgi:hypothetical protein